MMTLEEKKLRKKELARKWYLKNKELTIARSKKWHEENKEKAKEHYSKYQKSKKGLLTKKKYRDNNPEKIKKYLLENKDRIQKIKNIRENFRRKNDINFCLTKRLRRRLWGALNREDKSKKTMELLGCTIEEFKKYLESKFTKGMTWDKIHIDHIKPCISFDLTNPEEQVKCFHYTNLQPLWAIDNLKKGAKYEQ